MNTYFIYAVMHRRTSDAYVGCTTRIESRWPEHTRQLALNQHGNHNLQAAWNKDGWKAFTLLVLETLVDVGSETAKRAELKWIASIGSYNAVQPDPTKQRFVLPPEVRLKLAEQNRHRGKSPEFREIMREHTKRRWADPELRKPLLAGLEQGNGFYKGMPAVKSPEQIAAHAEHMKALWADPERRKKLEARRAARWKDPEAKARQAEKMRAYHAARRAAEE
jgi:group I intron endonuclease